MGGFGGMGMGHGPGYGAGAGRGMRQPTMVPRRGGRIVERPPVVNKGNPGGGDGGRGPTHHPIIAASHYRHAASADLPIPTSSQSPPPNGTSRFGGAGGGDGGGGGGMPPRGERRFVPDEVITAFSPDATPQAIEQFARRYNLTQARNPKLSADRRTASIAGASAAAVRSASIVDALEDENIVASVQPNYIFSLQEDAAKIQDAAKIPPTGDAPTIRAWRKLQIEQAHRVATGKNIAVALIDSEIDAKNPDLDSAIVKNFDALGGDDKPHQHGTAMAGAIAAHGKLLGIAPGAQLLAAHAFDETPATPRARPLRSTKACNGRRTTARAS